MKRSLIIGCVLLACVSAAYAGPYKVFILAGQSNMEGQGTVPADARRNGGKGSLEFLVKDPASAPRFKHLVDANGKWVSRDDVWIWYLGRTGALTVGFGAKADLIGPEPQRRNVLPHWRSHGPGDGQAVQKTGMKENCRPANPGRGLVVRIG